MDRSPSTPMTCATVRRCFPIWRPQRHRHRHRPTLAAAAHMTKFHGSHIVLVSPSPSPQATFSPTPRNHEAGRQAFIKLEIGISLPPGLVDHLPIGSHGPWRRILPIPELTSSADQTASLTYPPAACTIHSPAASTVAWPQFIHHTLKRAPLRGCRKRQING